jgi:hypothetical protein
MGFPIHYRDAKVFLAQFNLSGDLNSISLTQSVDINDGTQFGASSKVRLPGMYTAQWDLKGFSQFGTGLNDELIQARVGQIDLPMTIIPEGLVYANPALFFKAALGMYKWGAPQGGLIGFEASGQTSGWQIINGKVEELGAVARTATGNSAGTTAVGAVSATQYLYGIVHVLSATGTLDLVIESYTTGAFTSPTTRLTFPQITAVGSNILRAAGPITDTFFRFKWTLAASPSFTFLAALGIF